MEDYEGVLLVKQEVFVYKIPPRATNRGYRAADWNLQTPDWTGRMRLVSKGNECIMKLEDKTSGELFAKCPIEKYPGIAIEAVTDSSRYFVVRIQDDSGRSAFIGVGFADRGDSFDLNVALQDHFKWVEKTEKIEEEEKSSSDKPQLDLSFKEGQTITINMKIGQKTTGTSRPKAKNSAIGMLPPPPTGGMKIAPPPGASLRTISPSEKTNTNDSENIPANNHASANSSLLLDLDPMSTAPALSGNDLPAQSGDLWGDFASAKGPAVSGTGANNVPSTISGNWVQF